MAQDLINEIKLILSEEMEIPYDQIQDETELINDLGLDSVNVIELLYVLKKRTGYTIDRSELVNIMSFQDLVKFIEKKGVKK